MSLVGSDVWTRSEQLLRESSRALGVAIQSPKESGFQRVYMFSFPVFNKIARLDRERQLFNATMQDHILHEHRRNPWFKRTFFALFYLTAFWMLFYSPPQFLEKHPFYTNINRLKAAGKKQWQSNGKKTSSPQGKGSNTSRTKTAPFGKIGRASCRERV